MKKFLFLVLFSALAILRGEEQWFGVLDGEMNDQLGVQMTWNLGMIIDLDDFEGTITEIQYKCLSSNEGGPQGNLSWSICEIDGSGNWTGNVLDQGDIAGHDPSLSTTEWRVADVEGEAVLSGKIGLVITVEGGGNWGIDENSNYNMSYVKMMSWIKIGESMLSGYLGDWTLKCLFSNGDTDINEFSNAPNEISLEQNYPNPFNPTTSINYSLNSASKVNLTVFNANGKVVSELVNRNEAAGNHSVSFDGSNLNSGVYFYKLTVNGISETKKMVLTK
ncbi:MAG: hypothetical protein CSA15_03870 [Candidatus Delongbacteria bacterium]|nr:MAG: hypothetical protein CSA15_03870 [Candidatus Delongbacteria bacterium]